MSKEQSLKNRITNYFAKHPDKWYNGGTIEEFALTAGYKASNASRRLRELHEENILERKIEFGSVWYRWHSQLASANLEKKLSTVDPLTFVQKTFII